MRPPASNGRPRLAEPFVERPPRWSARNEGTRVKAVADHTSTLWPALPYEEWKDTYATLHMWTQIVGKIALALGAAAQSQLGASRLP